MQTVWLGGSILSFYKSDYTSRKTFIIIKVDILAPMQVPSSVQMTKTVQSKLGWAMEGPTLSRVWREKRVGRRGRGGEGGEEREGRRGRGQINL